MLPSYEQIKAQIELLESSVRDTDSLDIRWRLGRQYSHLAKWENPVKNFHEAIKHFKIVMLQVDSASSRSQLDYYSDTASAYMGLSDYEDAMKNLGIAKQYYELAYSQPDKPLEHETGIAINLANVHLGLAQIENQRSNLHEAIRYSLITINRAYDGRQITYAKDNLVQAYRELAIIDDDISLLYKAVEAMQETVDFFASDNKSHDYAIALGNLATIHIAIAKNKRTLSVWEDTEKALRDAVNAYQMAGDRMHATLGDIQIMNCKIEKAGFVSNEETKLRLHQEIISIFEQLDLSIISDYPEDLAYAYELAGRATLFIGAINDKTKLDRALQYFTDSLNYYAIVDICPDTFGQITEEIATIYTLKNQRKLAKKFLQHAINFYIDDEQFESAKKAKSKLDRVKKPFDWLFELFQ